LPDLHWLLLKEEQIILSVAKKRREEVSNEEPVVTKWDSLPSDLQDNIFQRLEFKDLFRCKTLSTAWKEHIESDAFCKWRGATSSGEGSFTALSYYIKNKAWQCSGYDLHSRMWRSLPTFSYLPAPDAELFKEYSVCGHGGLMCADVSKLPKKGELIVFNPLTRKKRALPSLIYPRSPVLVHLSINSVTKSYKVIVAGSSTASDEHLSKKMEVFDSKTSQWEVAPELPGPAFGLNEHQAGVCVDAVLYFISFLEGDCRRGVVAFDVEHKKWLDHKACPIPFSTSSNTLQLVETGGTVYLFSEQERGGSVEHCIDVLEHPSRASEKCKWRNVVRVKKSGGRGLQVYPEHTCVSFGDGKLCVFNTLTRDGVVYDMQDGKQVEVLQPPPPDQKGDNFFSLNPASFTLQPNFDSDHLPPTVDAI
jgi:F-box interacting protein